MRGIVENDGIFPYPQKFTDIRKYLSAVPYPRPLLWRAIHQKLRTYDPTDVNKRTEVSDLCCRMIVVRAT